MYRVLKFVVHRLYFVSFVVTTTTSLIKIKCGDGEVKGGKSEGS